MDLETACKVLELDISELPNITLKELKKQYHSMALKHHPDKNKSKNKSVSTFHFQQIQESYEYLFKQINICTFDEENDPDFKEELKGRNKTETETEKDYIQLVVIFISSIVKGISKDTLTNIMKNILSGWKKISLKLFDELDREKAFEIYSFICKYKNILYVNDTIIKKVEEILIDKFKEDKVFILNPNIHHLFENNIYKLIIDNETYLVPLWHNELYFDNNIIVFCIPELDKNISIDENNNIFIELNISWDFIKKEKKISFTLGNNVFLIPIDELFIKPLQIYTLKQKGISQMNN